MYNKQQGRPNYQTYGPVEVAYYQSGETSYRVSHVAASGTPKVESVNPKIDYYCEKSVDETSAWDKLVGALKKGYGYLKKVDETITSFIGGVGAGILQSTAEGVLFIEGAFEYVATGNTRYTTKHLNAVKQFFEQGKAASANPTAYQVGKVVGDIALIAGGIYGAAVAAPAIAEAFAGMLSALGFVGTVGVGEAALSTVSIAALTEVIGAGIAAAAAATGGTALGKDVDKLKDDLESKHKISTGDKTPKGREFSEHGAERANERGFDPNTIDSIIDNNYKHRVKEINENGEVRWRYQDKRGNTVITDEWGDTIVTVYSYPKSANGGNYIPKGFYGNGYY